MGHLPAHERRLPPGSDPDYTVDHEEPPWLGVHLPGGDLAFLEATLLDADGAVTATATATARVIALGDARTAA